MAGRPEIAFLASMADTTRTEAVGPFGAAPSQAVIPAKRFFNSEAGQAGIALQRRLPVIPRRIEPSFNSRWIPAFAGMTALVGAGTPSRGMQEWATR